MADMVKNCARKAFKETVLPAEKLRIQVLNADGTEKKLVYEASSPSGETATVDLGFLIDFA